MQLLIVRCFSTIYTPLELAPFTDWKLLPWVRLQNLDKA